MYRAGGPGATHRRLKSEEADGDIPSRIFPIVVWVTIAIGTVKVDWRLRCRECLTACCIVSKYGCVTRESLTTGASGCRHLKIHDDLGKETNHEPLRKDIREELYTEA